MFHPRIGPHKNKVMVLNLNPTMLGRNASSSEEEDDYDLGESAYIADWNRPSIENIFQKGKQPIAA